MNYYSYSMIILNSKFINSYDVSQMLNYKNYIQCIFYKQNEVNLMKVNGNSFKINFELETFKHLII